jgi:hypothetical protein
LYLNKQARQSLAQIRNLEGVDESLDRLQSEIERQQRTYQKFDNDLQAANVAYEKNPAWPAEASRLSAEVVKRFPIDPGVKELNRKLRNFRLKVLGIRAGLVLFAILILAALAAWGNNRYQAYLLAQTPTLTPTATSTATLTLAHPDAHPDLHLAAHLDPNPDPYPDHCLHPKGYLCAQRMLRKIYCHRKDPLC